MTQPAQVAIGLMALALDGDLPRLADQAASLFSDLADATDVEQASVFLGEVLGCLAMRAAGYARMVEILQPQWNAREQLQVTALEVAARTTPRP